MYWWNSITWAPPPQKYYFISASVSNIQEVFTKNKKKLVIVSPKQWLLLLLPSRLATIFIRFFLWFYAHLADRRDLPSTCCSHFPTFIVFDPWTNSNPAASLCTTHMKFCLCFSQGQGSNFKAPDPNHTETPKISSSENYEERKVLRFSGFSISHYQRVKIDQLTIFIFCFYLEKNMFFFY